MWVHLYIVFPLHRKTIFSLPVQMYKKCCCISSGISIGSGVRGGVGVSKMLKFYLKFYVMGKVPSGELSCTWTGLVVTSSLLPE